MLFLVGSAPPLFATAQYHGLHGFLLCHIPGARYLWACDESCQCIAALLQYTSTGWCGGSPRNVQMNVQLSATAHHWKRAEVGKAVQHGMIPMHLVGRDQIAYTSQTVFDKMSGDQQMRHQRMQALQPRRRNWSAQPLGASKLPHYIDSCLWPDKQRCGLRWTACSPGVFKLVSC